MPLGVVTAIILFFVCVLFFGTAIFPILSYVPIIGGIGVVFFSFYRFARGTFSFGHRQEKKGEQLFEVMKNVDKYAPLKLAGKEDVKKSENNKLQCK